MLNRRATMAGGLAMAVSSSTRSAFADADRPMLVFVGHEL
ncbi:hypothetical protein SAMN02745126_00246 [Enhydrobacter aerosaccus]|uniref:Uncharacterized protein n=1 Tax=Enhydrobacter aerosaccus TaxID=225324 RepID=A0A1T4JNF0_9HYPH|nr:hypothetical protein SAMN02745126_00246 [Enhydrobacter aerosaccus]